MGSVGKSRAFAEVGLVVIWSSGFIGAKLGTQEASTPTFVVWRSLFATYACGLPASDPRVPPFPYTTALSRIAGVGEFPMKAQSYPPCRISIQHH
jgi:hypothetical protein